MLWRRRYLSWWHPKKDSVSVHKSETNHFVFMVKGMRRDLLRAIEERNHQHGGEDSISVVGGGDSDAVV